jgi:hypothetical protein
MVFKCLVTHLGRGAGVVLGSPVLVIGVWFRVGAVRLGQILANSATGWALGQGGFWVANCGGFEGEDSGLHGYFEDVGHAPKVVHF